MRCTSARSHTRFDYAMFIKVYAIMTLKVSGSIRTCGDRHSNDTIIVASPKEHAAKSAQELSIRTRVGRLQITLVRSGLTYMRLMSLLFAGTSPHSQLDLLPYRDAKPNHWTRLDAEGVADNNMTRSERILVKSPQSDAIVFLFRHNICVTWP
jgi:hypothetical protein